MKPGDLVASAFFILVGIYVTISAIGLKVGTPIAPKPGFFPFLGGLTMIGLSGILLFKACFGRSTGTQAFGKIGNLFLVLLGLVFYIATLESMGYLISTTILSVIVLRVLGTKSGSVLIGTSLILAIGSYLLFSRFLDVPLPKGIMSKIF